MKDKTPRQHAKEQQAFFTKFEVNSNYLPKEMQKDGWGGTLKSEGPTSRDREKDILAIMFFFGHIKPTLYECLVAAGKQLKEKEEGTPK